MKDPEDAKQLAKMMEQERVFEFLASLNSEFDEVSGRVSGKEPFSSLEECFSSVSNEEDRKAILIRTPSAEHSIDVLALKSKFKNSIPMMLEDKTETRREKQILDGVTTVINPDI
ncbi:hypothetical protein PanWU01x14_323310 [Parasponia andersonii]|uniref:Uncharacterized protein n=1 Tax=Parasponia andersonii TaxID=3476 RepID=A0A2P5AKH1_PARAD|nr:hypothetical protein PanWU01x14_323310 [Parasponia andersonii]